jgi:hypothetical protein
MTIVNTHAPCLPCMPAAGRSTVLYVLVQDENVPGRNLFRVYAGIVPAEMVDEDGPRREECARWVAARGTKLRLEAARLQFPGLKAETYAA